MIQRQNLWFVTLFSLILVLGVYYVTMPSEALKTMPEEEVVEEVIEESPLTALRVSKETTRKEKIDSLESSLTMDNLSTEEKNNTYELLKYLNEVQGKEDSFEKSIAKELGLDCYVKIENQNTSVICISEEHNKELANKIMRMIQKEYKKKMNVTVEFQKK